MAATGYTSGDPQKVSRSGDTLTGELVLPDSSPDSALTAASRGYVDNSVAAATASSETRYVNVSGDTMTGPLVLDHGNITTDVGHDLTLMASTGVIHQDGPITLASPTSVNIPAGQILYVESHHSHPSPALRTVSYGPTVVTLENPTESVTYFMVDGSGSIVQNAGPPSRAQRRQYAVLGRAVVLGGSIVALKDSPVLVSQPMSLPLDILSSLGDIRVSGIVVSPIAGTMTFSVSAGEIFNLGANNEFNPDDPNVSPFNAVSPAQFRYLTRSSVVDVNARTLVDPTIYDVGGVATAVPGGAGTTTIQRVHCFSTQGIYVQLGQIAYSSLAAAIDALSLGDTSEFVTHPEIRQAGIRTAFILVTKSASNLSDTTSARFSRATRLGDPGGVS
jgi:hypothetical protein